MKDDVQENDMHEIMMVTCLGEMVAGRTVNEGVSVYVLVLTCAGTGKTRNSSHQS